MLIKASAFIPWQPKIPKLSKGISISTAKECPMAGAFDSFQQPTDSIDLYPNKLSDYNELLGDPGHHITDYNTI